MFIDVFQKLCAERGVSLSRALLDLDMSKASISRWKTGGSPTNSSKRKIADYFSVPVSVLNEEKKLTPELERELSDGDMKLVNDIMRLSDDRKRLVVALLEDWKQNT